MLIILRKARVLLSTKDDEYSVFCLQKLAHFEQEGYSSRHQSMLAHILGVDGYQGRKSDPVSLRIASAKKKSP